MTVDESLAKPWWSKPTVGFLVDTLVGAVAFTVIASVAVALSFLVNYLEQQRVDIFILLGLRLAEYVLFFIDILLFLRLLSKSARQTWNELS